MAPVVLMGAGIGGVPCACEMWIPGESQRLFRKGSNKDFSPL